MSEKQSTRCMYDILLKVASLTGNFADPVSWLQERNSAGGLLGCMCLLIDGVLRIQAKVQECQILNLASLHSFPGNRTLIILLAAANVL